MKDAFVLSTNSSELTNETVIRGFYDGHMITDDLLPDGCKDFIFDGNTHELKGFVPNDVNRIGQNVPADFHYDMEGRILGMDEQPYQNVSVRNKEQVMIDGIPVKKRYDGFEKVYTDRGVLVVNSFRNSIGLSPLKAVDYTKDGHPIARRRGNPENKAISEFLSDYSDEVEDKSDNAVTGLPTAER